MITRKITNIGDPLCAPNGEGLRTLLGNVHVHVRFQLVNASGVACSAWDAISNERVAGMVDVVTDENGIFPDVELWPNDRGSTVTFYRCKVFSPGVEDFIASLPSGDLSPLQWIIFAANGTALVPAEMHGVYVQHSMATAANDVLVGGGIGAWVKKTLSEFKIILGLGSAAYTDSSDYDVLGAAAFSVNGHLAAYAHGDIAHANRAALDMVSGVNNGDQTGATLPVTSHNIGNSEYLDPFLANVDDSLTALKATGFGAWTSGADATTYSIVDGKFQLNRAGYGYINGKKISWIAGQQTGVLAANVFYFVYIDSAGLIQTSTNYPPNTIRVFEALYDGTVYFVAKENHPVEFQTALSGYLHYAAGTIIFGAGAIMTRVATGTGAAAGDRQIKIVGADTLSDHGLSTAIPDSAGAPVSIVQVFRNPAGKWIQLFNQTELAPWWNNAGVPELLVTPDTYCVFVLSVKKDDINSSAPQYFAVLDEAMYATLNLAQAAITNGTIVHETNELKSLEAAQLGYVIMKYTAAGGHIESIEIAKSSLSAQYVGAGVGASGNHALQSNLGYAESGHTGFQPALGFTPAPALDGEPNGFVDRTEVSLTWVDATRTLTISPVGASFRFYANGVLYTKSATENIVIADTQGTHYVYYDSSGVLSESATFNTNIMQRYAIAAVIAWNATTQKAVPDAMAELHGCEWPAELHSYVHNTIGTVYKDGLAVTVVAEGDGSLASHAEVAAALGNMYDEDIPHVITAHAITDDIPVMYRTGASAVWTYDATSPYIVRTTGTGRAAYNQYTGGAWQLTEVTNGNLVYAHLYAVPGITKKWMVVMGSNQYNTVNAAREAALTDVLSITGIALPEFLLVASILVQTNNSYTNAVKSRIRYITATELYIDWRIQPKLGSVPLASHNNLEGLNDGDFQHLTVAEKAALLGLYWTETLYNTGVNATIHAVRMQANSTSVNVDAVISPKGSGAILAQVPDGTATGGNKRGANSFDMQRVRTSASMVASGANSAQFGENNTTSGLHSFQSGYQNTASGSYSAVFGYNNMSSASATFIAGGSNTIGGGGAYGSALGYYNVIGGNYAFAVGRMNVSNGEASSAIGYGCEAYAQGSTAIGMLCKAIGVGSIALGYAAYTNVTGKIAYGAGSWTGTAGEAQGGLLAMRGATTSNVAAVLTSNGQAAGLTNQFVIPTHQAAIFEGRIIGKRQNSANIVTYKVEGRIVNNGGAVTVDGVTLTAIGADTIGLDAVPTFTADNTNKALTVTSGYKTSTNIRWVCNLWSTEVIYTP